MNDTQLYTFAKAVKKMSVRDKTRLLLLYKNRLEVLCDGYPCKITESEMKNW